MNTSLTSLGSRLRRLVQVLPMLALVSGPILAGGSLWIPSVAHAGDDEGNPDDDVGKITGGKKEQSVKDEKKDLEEGKTDDKVGVKSESTLLPDEKKHRLIKTLQKKDFLKIGRYEASPHIGFVTNDPFINRYLLGASFAYHLTEIFALEANFDYSPDFKEGDWKFLTNVLVNENKVSPDISKIYFDGSFNFQFSPIYGKIAVSGKNIIKFDIFGSFGTGVVYTVDDLKALQTDENDAQAAASEKQYHPTTDFGGGFRVIFSKSFAARLEGRSMIYIETINSTTLEMKNNFMLLGSASIFFPNMKQ